MVVNNDILIVNITNELSRLDVEYMFDDINSNQFKNENIIKCRSLDILKQSLMSSLTSLPKNFLY